MEGLEGQGHIWNPFFFLGIDNPLLKINVETVLSTWMVLTVLLCVLLSIRFFLKDQASVITYLAKQYALAFRDLTMQALGFFHYRHFVFVTALFTFILLCNWISFIPGFEEPTADLNTALAMGIISFLYREIYTILAHGWWGYFKEFLHPFFIMFPLNVIGHLSKVVSISFRLFGNIFGGSIITKLYANALNNSVIWQTVGLVTGINIVVAGFFIFFEGLIQAFVFSILTITYLGMALQEEE